LKSLERANPSLSDECPVFVDFLPARFFSSATLCQISMSIMSSFEAQKTSHPTKSTFRFSFHGFIAEVSCILVRCVFFTDSLQSLTGFTDCRWRARKQQD
jgi:hypothetical protein